MKIPNLRWMIAAALLLAAVLNYIDRSVLGLLATTIQSDLGISDQQYASVINCFLIAYTLAYLVSGRIVDRLGVRLSLALFVGWWSISNALTGLAQSVRSLSVFRFMLGLGEAGGFTASPKAISEWFPPAERGIAIGIYSVGGALGATIAPILVALIAANFGWRWVFAVSPVFAGLWLVLWLWLYKKPSDHPLITDKERTYLASSMEPINKETTKEKVSERALWGRVFRERFVWQLMLARLLTDPVWYFYQFWMPKYLQSTRGLDQKGVSIMWMIFLAADLGFLIGGFLSGKLIKRGIVAPSARLWIMLFAAGLVPLSFFVPAMQTVDGVVFIGMIVTFAHTAWLTNLTSLVVDIVPGRILGTAFGVIACGSTLGGILMNQVVAWLIGHSSYNDCFLLMAFLHPLALLIIWGLRRSSIQTSVQQIHKSA
jgi:ACS family hexuronate transporter-like MFS transporter